MIDSHYSLFSIKHSLLLMFLLPWNLVQADIPIFPGRAPIVIRTPRDVESCDFNGDGIDDLAVVHDLNRIAILLGSANQRYEIFANVSLEQPARLQFIAVGDLNGDGYLDLIARDESVSVYILLQDPGGGGFMPEQIIDVGWQARALELGDLNNDGLIDIVSNSNNENSISVILGNANGNFKVDHVIEVELDTNDTKLGDFDGDGNLDLVLVQDPSDSISILRGNGTGSFEAWQMVAVDNEPWKVGIADLNSDGWLDIAVSESEITVLLNTGNGQFGSGNQLEVNGIPRQAPVAGDFNSDGKIDLAVPTIEGVSVFSGNGTGNFESCCFRNTSDPQSALVVGDFNGDGVADLTTTLRHANRIPVLFGHAEDFLVPLYSTVGSDICGHAMADFDQDLILDLAVLRAISPHTYTVNFWLGNGTGGFDRTGNIYNAIRGGYVAMEAGDLNDDGLIDLAMAAGNLSYGDVSVFFSLGNGEFDANNLFQMDVGQSWSILIEDINSDNIKDMVIGSHWPTNELQTQIGLGSEDFENEVFEVFGNQHYYHVAAADLNNDGFTDFATAGEVFLGNELGELNSNQFLPGNVGGVAFADLDNNGTQDVITGVLFSDGAIDDEGAIRVLSGNGDGTFGPDFDTYDCGDFPAQIDIADFNNDGILDILTLNHRSDDISYFRGRGDGSFEPEQRFLVGRAPHNLSYGDLNGDGYLDLVVTNRLGLSLSILMNQLADFVLGDVNDDGSADLLDVQPFVQLIVAGKYLVEADINCDGQVDLLDVQPFVEILTGD